MNRDYGQSIRIWRLIFVGRKGENVIEKSIWNYSGFQIWMLEVMDYWI
jgi:hypothetical protein